MKQDFTNSRGGGKLPSTRNKMPDFTNRDSSGSGGRGAKFAPDMTNGPVGAPRSIGLRKGTQSTTLKGPLSPSNPSLARSLSLGGTCRSCK